VDSISRKLIEKARFEESSTKSNVCGYSVKKSSQRHMESSSSTFRVLIFHRNVLQLRKRIKEAWSHRHEHHGAKFLSYLVQVMSSEWGLVRCCFIHSTLISSAKKGLAIPSRPFDFIRTGSNAAYSIFISNSGSTPDIMGAIRHARKLVFLGCCS